MAYLAKFTTTNHSRDFVLLPAFDSGSVSQQAVKMIYAVNTDECLTNNMLEDIIPERPDCKEDGDTGNIVEYRENKLQARRFVL